MIRNGTTAWSSPSRQSNIPPTRKTRMNKPFGKAREGSYIFQFDTSLWSHNVELFGRTLLVIFFSYFCHIFILSQDALPAGLRLLIRNGTRAWSSLSRQNDIPPTRKVRMNKPFGKAREGSYIFQFDTSLWSHNVELFGRTGHVIFLSYFCHILPQFFPRFAPCGTQQSWSKPGRLQVRG